MCFYHRTCWCSRLVLIFLWLSLWFCCWLCVPFGQTAEAITRLQAARVLPLTNDQSNATRSIAHPMVGAPTILLNTAPALHIPTTPQPVANNRLNVPILLTGNGKSIAALAFAVDYEEGCLLFDATDSDGDGVPDAISGLPVDFAVTVVHHGEQSSAELEVAIYNAMPPIHTLSDGVLLVVQFVVRTACRPQVGAPTSVTINFATDPAVSFGDPASTDLEGTATGATIQLTLNRAPTALLLNSQQITETSPISTIVGILSTTDPDSGDSHSYTMTTGVGSADNGSFIIDGATLKTATIFDYETKTNYTLRVRTTDSGGLFWEQRFVITITNVNESPIAVADPIDPRTRVFVGGQTAAIDVLANDSTPLGVLRVLSVTQPLTGSGLVINNGATISYTAPNANGSASFHYIATNDYGASTPVTVSVHYVANQVRGDCNSSGAIGAGDFVGVVREIFDTNDWRDNGASAWWLTHTGDYPGSPLGCDANASANGPNNTSDSITAADLICAVLRFFHHECWAVQAAQAGRAHLSIAPVTTAATEQTISVTLATDGQAVAAVAFALKLGDAIFDASDADGDGIPDTVTLTVPPALSKRVTWNAAANRLEVALYGTRLPLPTLPDGVLATVRIRPGAATAPPMLTLVSLSDVYGHDLPINTRAQLFLPFILR